jgi:hypothetical protein
MFLVEAAMLRFAALLAFVLSFVSPAPVLAWHIGPNFGFSRASGTSLFNWGSGTNILGVSQPGMRVGWSIGGKQNEIYTATGLDVISADRETAYGVTATFNYQRNFTDNAFITVGGGVFSLGDGSTSATVPVFGGGIGYLHPLPSGQGRFRWEMRLDRQGEDADFGLPKTNLFTVRLGFDLMM